MALVIHCFEYQVALSDQLRGAAAQRSWAAMSFALLNVRPCVRQVPRRRVSSRQRTSRFMGVGSSNRKNQWQARILVHGKARRPRPCCQAPLHALKSTLCTRTHGQAPILVCGLAHRVSFFC